MFLNISAKHILHIDILALFLVMILIGYKLIGYIGTVHSSIVHSLFSDDVFTGLRAGQPVTHIRPQQ